MKTEFHWLGFDMSSYEQLKKQILDEMPACEIDFCGNIRIGEICFDLVARDYEEKAGGPSLDYDCYVGGESGYSTTGSPEFYPYDLAGGGSLCTLESIKAMDYAEFKVKAEEELCRFIVNGNSTAYSLEEKAEMPFHDWN